MSPRLLAVCRAVERRTIAIDREVRLAYGDDMSRYPRDFYRPADALRRRVVSVMTQVAALA